MYEGLTGPPLGRIMRASNLSKHRSQAGVANLQKPRGVTPNTADRLLLWYRHSRQFTDGADKLGYTEGPGADIRKIAAGDMECWRQQLQQFDDNARAAL